MNLLSHFVIVILLGNYWCYYYSQTVTPILMFSPTTTKINNMSIVTIIADFFVGFQAKIWVNTVSIAGTADSHFRQLALAC
jgi:hypothetical protein